MMLERQYLWAEKKWFALPEKLRFLLVGGANTLLAYIVLNLLDALLRLVLIDSAIYAANIALILQNIITINISFITMRYYVFQSHGVFWHEWLKCVSVYAFMYVFNAVFMTLLMSLLVWPLWLAQLVYIIVSTLLIFCLHKFFSFRPQHK
ncbi:MAG: GtrA family protein [Alphaproteobacteria bacterium]|nr:GtrA family protein [Alphaproteobacteria bacterium]